MHSGDLKTQLAQGGPLDPARAVHLVRQVAAAIDDAHAHQTVHRDVTSATILIGRSQSGQESAYLADSAAGTPSADRTRQLVTNTETTYRADIQALAAVLYECLTGHPPEPGAPVGIPGVPAGFDDVIARGMATDPDDGYRTATDLAVAAQAALTPTPPSRPSAAPTQTLRLPPAPPAQHAQPAQSAQSAPPAGPAQPPAPPKPVPPPPPPNQPPPNQPPPNQPPVDPYYGRSPTISYPHTRPVPLPMPRRRRRFLAPTLAIAVIVGLVIAGIIAIPRLVGKSSSNSASATTGATARHNYTAQPTTLGFPDLDRLKSVSVDAAGNVYVLASALGPGDSGPFDPLWGKLFKLAPGAAAATTLDFPSADFRVASDMAVDPAGAIYLCDHAEVWKLDPGAPFPMRLPFRGFVSIEAVGFDAAGNTYAAGPLNTPDVRNIKYGVKKLARGETRPTDLTFPEVYMPKAIAVDKAGNVVVSSGVKNEGKGRIFKLAAGATTPTELSFPGLLDPVSIAVDRAGNIFVADDYSKGLFELPVGAPSAIRLLTQLHPTSVAIDSADNLYITVMAAKDKNEHIVKPGQVLKVAPDK